MNETRVMTLEQLVPSSLELVVLDGSLKGKTYPLIIGRQSFGRGPDNHLVFEDASISRQHGVIDYDGKGKVVVYDLASRNGIFYKGRPCPVLTVKKGKTFQIGAIPLKLQKKNCQEKKTRSYKIPFLLGTVFILILTAFAFAGVRLKGPSIQTQTVAPKPLTTPTQERVVSRPPSPPRPRAIPEKVAEQVTTQELGREAQEAFLKGDYLQALNLWQKILSEDPNDPEAQNGLQKLEKRASQIYEEALMTSNTSPKKSEEMLKTAQAMTLPESSIHQQASEVLALWGSP